MTLHRNISYATLVAGIALMAIPSSGHAAEKLSAYPDGSRISLTGTVVSTASDEFVLNYGNNSITVEMDDWDWYVNEAEALIPGESVTVTGNIDDDLFEGREIEADTVLVHDSYDFYVVPETSYTIYTFDRGIPDRSWVSTTGIVQEKLNSNEFIVSSSKGDTMQVDVASMANNPLDDEGTQQVDIGDRVYVAGLFDEGFIENQEILADTIVVLNENKATSSGS